MSGMQRMEIRRAAPRDRAGSLGRGVALLAGLLLLPAPFAGGVDAQTPGAAAGPLEERLRQRFGELVQRELELNDETQRALAGVLDRFDEERRDIARRTAALRVRLAGRASLDPGRRGAPLLENEEAGEILAERREIREDEYRLAREEEEALLEVLSEPQLVRFLALRDELTQRVRRIRRGRSGGPGSEAAPAGGAATLLRGPAPPERGWTPEGWTSTLRGPTPSPPRCPRAPV